MLKGMKISQRGNLSVRKALVVFQFTVSTVLIAGTIVLCGQVRFMNTTDLGFTKDLMGGIDVNTSTAQLQKPQSPNGPNSFGQNGIGYLQRVR